MNKKLILIARIVDDNGGVLSEQSLPEKIIMNPENLHQLGLTQEEQLQYIGEVERIFIQEQTHSLLCSFKCCPKCNGKIWHNGSSPSLFHGFYNDHNLELGKWVCSSISCDWSYNPSIDSYFGDNTSPELKKSQAELGATLPYRKGAACLKLLTGNKRKVHNHMRIRAVTQELGDEVEKYLTKETAKKTSAPVKEDGYAKELIITADGAYVHDADNKGHNFEAMIAKIFRPEDLIYKDKHHGIITQKQCIGSAKKDKQEVMKGKVVEAAKRSGMTKKTTVTGLADGAHNCWNVIKSLTVHCMTVLCILDWFHIGKYFKNVENQLSKKEKRLLKVAKTKLWHGHIESCLDWLQMIKDRVADKKQLDKLQSLIDYLIRNKEYIVNYDGRRKDGLLYTSSIAESTVEHYASARLKKSQKMQWTRDGAHQVLQIRGTIVSNVWDQFCDDVLGTSSLKKCA